MLNEVSQRKKDKYCMISLICGIYKKAKLGNSLVVQWLGFGTFTAGALVQSLVGELRSCKPCGMAKNIIIIK